MKHEALLLLQRQFFQTNMTTIDQRYSSAIRSRDLGVDPKTTRSDSDVVGAMGLADRTLTRGHTAEGLPLAPCPLAVPLARLLAGDNHSARQVVRLLSDTAHKRSFKLRVRISRIECHEMAQACLAWFRHGSCKACGGHGKLVIPGTVVLGHQDCESCKGRGRVAFETTMPKNRRVLAAWLAAEIERALSYAGPQAMAHLAPRLVIGDGD